jgi:hypothetical protein
MWRAEVVEQKHNNCATCTATTACLVTQFGYANTTALSFHLLSFIFHPSPTCDPIINNQTSSTSLCAPPISPSTTSYCRFPLVKSSPNQAHRDATFTRDFNSTRLSHTPVRCQRTSPNLHIYANSLRNLQTSLFGRTSTLTTFAFATLVHSHQHHSSTCRPNLINLLIAFLLPAARMLVPVVFLARMPEQSQQHHQLEV